MILPEYNAIFIHIPKTAGQSIENFLLESLGKTRTAHGADYLLKKNNTAIGPRRLAHLRATQYATLGYLNKHESDAYYSFAFVRNPWERVVSFYNYSGFSSLVSFKNFALYYLPELYNTANWFYRPQHEFVCNNKDELIINFLGKFESLNTDFKIVAKQLNIPFSRLPQDNVSNKPGLFSKKSLGLLREYPGILKRVSLTNHKNKAYQEYYCDATRKVVKQLYGKDIVLFNYTFNNNAKAI